MKINLKLVLDDLHTYYDELDKLFIGCVKLMSAELVKEL
jgi:hypothetical protein